MFADHRTPHDGLNAFQFGNAMQKQQQPQNTMNQQHNMNNMNTNHNNNSNSLHTGGDVSRQASNEEQQREFRIDDINQVAQNENYTQHQPMQHQTMQNHTTFGIGLDDSQDNDNQNSTFEAFTDNHIGLS